jgi:hypothetical protein
MSSRMPVRASASEQACHQARARPLDILRLDEDVYIMCQLHQLSFLKIVVVE